MIAFLALALIVWKFVSLASGVGHWLEQLAHRKSRTTTS
jgi:hypothetical protein